MCATTSHGKAKVHNRPRCVASALNRSNSTVEPGTTRDPPGVRPEAYLPGSRRQLPTRAELILRSTRIVHPGSVPSRLIADPERGFLRRFHRLIQRPIIYVNRPFGIFDPNNRLRSDGWTDAEHLVLERRGLTPGSGTGSLSAKPPEVEAFRWCADCGGCTPSRTANSAGTSSRAREVECTRKQ